ncbi:ABC transporter substrate-binding protein [Geminicoccus roseus]|uniref:ABC transporter substrate-binding protein n=1 Tax=Geminicoccus roseus TaxID=404900 RepID=UPI00042965A7|nr:ABC transporter substrate-binding protein [Geminicoccus roseus]
MKHILPAILALTAISASPAAASGFPVTVESCGQPLTFEAAPQRAVVHDQNIAEIMFALDLQKHMVGLTGITGWYKMTPEFSQAMGDIPELAPKYPTMENLLAVDPDFFFAGWYYGMNPGGEVTPDTLGVRDVPVYVLTESCIHVDKEQPAASLATLYTDVENIGAIFGRKEDADRLVKGWKERVGTVAEAVADAQPVEVFLYDSGEDKPFTAGRYAMPTAIIQAAGGRNVMDDVETSWGTVSWEAVIERDPAFIVLVDYDAGGWEKSWAFLESHPATANLTAVKEKRYLPLRYGEITPGPANIEAIEKLARALHPDAFAE